MYTLLGCDARLLPAAPNMMPPLICHPKSMHGSVMMEEAKIAVLQAIWKGYECHEAASKRNSQKQSGRWLQSSCTSRSVGATTHVQYGYALARTAP